MSKLTFMPATKKLAGIVDPEPEKEKSVAELLAEGEEIYRQHKRSMARHAWARQLEIKPSDIKGGSNVPRHFFTATPDGKGTLRWEEAAPGRAYSNVFQIEVGGVLYVAKR